ncbi:cytochrome c [Deinococcus sp. 14RED07]|uniref:c-type cytochrome n=1 Tax=Deinococcus sp. 14RED07 TaxID=2745874 RepID=UPI001E60738B|nr:cytochrome c [Deinococcus sp. 14RED07]MCD0177350.1 cytochrome c [Deinococcus sp. 14RED07]
MNRRTQREAGDVTSWAVGVTAGLILGVTLLIATPRLMTPPTTAEGATTSTTTRDAATQVESADAQEAATQGTAGQQEGGMQEEGAATAEASAEGEGEAATGEATEGASAGGAAPEAAAGNAEAGQTVYVGNCAACHGPNGQGQIGPSLVGEDGPKNWTLAQFTATLREGKTPDRQLSAAMPRYAETQISDEQVADLQAYIKTLN